MLVLRLFIVYLLAWMSQGLASRQAGRQGIKGVESGRGKGMGGVGRIQKTHKTELD